MMKQRRRSPQENLVLGILALAMIASRKYKPVRRRKSHKSLLNKTAARLWRQRRFSPLRAPYVRGEKQVQLLDKESCGNFLIHENQTQPMQIWKSSSNVQAELTQISVFNERSSAGNLSVLISGDKMRSMQVYPGNTGTFTERNVKSIQVAAFEQSQMKGDIEGKYCVSSFFRLSKRERRFRCNGNCLK